VIDDFCKQLVARHPASAPGPTPDWQLLDRELSSEPLHADSVVLLPTNPGQTAAPILHLEFQTRPDPLMADPAGGAAPQTVRVEMMEVWQVPSTATPELKQPKRVAGLSGHKLLLVEGSEDLALAMGLLFKLLAPMRNVAAAAMPWPARIPGGCWRRCDCCSRQPRDNSGKQPVLAWLADQSPEVRASFAHLFELLESNGTAMGEPHVKPLGKKLYELRVNGPPFRDGAWRPEENPESRARQSHQAHGRLSRH
jgi:hypothetical protein